MRKLIMLTAIMLLVPAVSQAKTLEELLVEKGVITKGEAAAASASAPGSVSYAKGVRWEFSDKKVSGKLSTMIRTRWTFTDYDKDDSAHTKNTSSFDVTQARLIASGDVLDKEFSYFLQGDFVGDSSSDGKKSASLKDAYITYHACDWADVAMGQHKTGISRQFNTSDVDLQFPDYSVVSDYFSLGRQAGAWFSTKSPDAPLTLAAAIYNGESDGEGTNKSGLDTNHTAVLNARFDTGTINPFVESDIDGTQDLAASFGVAAAFSDAKNDLIGAGSTADNSVFTLDVDAIAKYQGWSFAAEYFYRSIDSDQVSEKINPSGFYAQAGYFVDPQIELAARYGYLTCDNGAGPGLCAGNESVKSVDVSANYYFLGNQLKAQLAWALLSENPENSDGSDLNTDRIIFNVSGLF